MKDLTDIEAAIICEKCEIVLDAASGSGQTGGAAQQIADNLKGEDGEPLEGSLVVADPNGGVDYNLEVMKSGAPEIRPGVIGVALRGGRSLWIERVDNPQADALAEEKAEADNDESESE